MAVSALRAPPRCVMRSRWKNRLIEQSPLRAPPRCVVRSRWKNRLIEQSPLRTPPRCVMRSRWKNRLIEQSPLHAPPRCVMRSRWKNRLIVQSRRLAPWMVVLLSAKSPTRFKSGPYFGQSLCSVFSGGGVVPIWRFAGLMWGAISASCVIVWLSYPALNVFPASEMDGAPFAVCVHGRLCQ